MRPGPKRWPSFLRRRRTVALPRQIPPSVDPRNNQPALPTLGFDVGDLRERLAQISINGGPAGELEGYARQDCERFLRTADLVPGGARRALEIGGAPYFTTLLLRWLRPELEMWHTNFFNEYTNRTDIHHVRIPGMSGIEDHTFPYHHVNVEDTPFPFDTGRFDLVLYCEVLEHMTNDPVASLREIHRVLQPGGTLILTTPNAARLESAARLIGGLNMYDQYSGHGAYGRHNREYTVEEIRALLTHCGFAEKRLYTADVYSNHAGLHVEDPMWLETICLPRRDLLGQYIFSCWCRAETPPRPGRPGWLYRSYGEEELSDEIPLKEPPGSRW